MAFAGPGTVKCNYIKIVVIKVQGKGKSLFEEECFASIIFDFDRANDGIKLFKNCVYNSNFCTKKVCLFGAHGN